MNMTFNTQSQLACDWFVSSLLLILGIFDRDPTRLLAAAGHFWESGGHQVTFNWELKPGAVFLIAI